jgi:hypothetical protein
LLDSGLIENLMPYSLYKKLVGTNDERIKTNMMISSVGEGDQRGCIDGAHRQGQGLDTIGFM